MVLYKLRGQNGMRFLTGTNYGEVCSERLRITSGGRVQGLATINPDEQLHLELGTTGDPRIKLETDGGGDPGIIFQLVPYTRTGEMFFQELALHQLDLAMIMLALHLNMYAHNQSSIDFYFK